MLIFFVAKNKIKISETLLEKVRTLKITTYESLIKKKRPKTSTISRQESTLKFRSTT
jgi:hypothetical protein